VNAPIQARGLKFSPQNANRWAYAIAAIAACSLALGVIFREEFVGAYRVWVDSATYNHCFLIIPISLYMIWERRGALASLSPVPDFRVLLLIPLLSLAWFGASTIGILEAQQLIVMTIFQAMLFGILGWPVYRRLMAPLLYLYFLVPSGEFLVPTLQNFTARFTVVGLQILGIPVYSDGILIDVPAGSFAVAEACAGLRFLIAAVAFGVFYATEIYESRVRRVIFIAFSIVVPVIANGFRALGLIAAAEAFGSATAVEADHITFGWVFFSLVLVALILIGRTFSDRNAPGSSRTLAPNREKASAYAPALALTAVGLFVPLAAIGPAIAAVLDAPRASLALPAVTPGVTPPWMPIGAPVQGWRPIVVRADRELSDSFADGPNRIERFVALYATRGRVNNLIRSDNRIADSEVWNIAASRGAVAHLGGKAIAVNAAEIVSGSHRKLVWSFYALDGTTAASLWDVKRHQLQAYITASRCPSAFIAVATDLTDRAQAAAVLDRFIAAMEPLPPYLCS
jgi:exosortase A